MRHCRKVWIFTEGNEGIEECICCDERQPLVSLLPSVEEDVSASRPVSGFKKVAKETKILPRTGWILFQKVRKKGLVPATQPLFSSLSSVQKVHLGAREATILSKRGSPRSESQKGSNFSWP